MSLYDVQWQTWMLDAGPGSLILPVTAARHLQQDPATYISIKGQQPGGFHAIGDQAEATAAASSRGIRYNNGELPPRLVAPCMAGHLITA